MLLNRNLLKIKVKDKPFSDHALNTKLQKVMQKYKLSKDEASFFSFRGTITNLAYSDSKQKIFLLTQKGKVTDITAVSDQINSKVLTNEITKNYLCYPKTKD